MMKLGCSMLRDGAVTYDTAAAFERPDGDGGVAVKCPAKKPRGQSVGNVQDNSGFLVETCLPMAE